LKFFLPLRERPFPLKWCCAITDLLSPAEMTVIGTLSESLFSFGSHSPPQVTLSALFPLLPSSSPLLPSPPFTPLTYPPPLSSPTSLIKNTPVPNTSTPSPTTFLLHLPKLSNFRFYPLLLPPSLTHTSPSLTTFLFPSSNTQNLTFTPTPKTSFHPSLPSPIYLAKHPKKILTFPPTNTPPRLPPRASEFARHLPFSSLVELLIFLVFRCPQEFTPSHFPSTRLYQFPVVRSHLLQPPLLASHFPLPGFLKQNWVFFTPAYPTDSSTPAPFAGPFILDNP